MKKKLVSKSIIVILICLLISCALIVLGALLWTGIEKPLAHFVILAIVMLVIGLIFFITGACKCKKLADILKHSKLDVPKHNQLSMKTN